jgi:uncharacterized protein YndB with AHSA1/START domain
MPGGTVTLHRVLRAPAERIYRAFLDPDAMAKWLPPHGFTGKVRHLDARVGGSYRMSFTNFATGDTHAFGGQYLWSWCLSSASGIPTASTIPTCRA